MKITFRKDALFVEGLTILQRTVFKDKKLKGKYRTAGDLEKNRLNVNLADV